VFIIESISTGDNISVTNGKLYFARYVHGKATGILAGTRTTCIIFYLGGLVSVVVGDVPPLSVVGASVESSECVLFVFSHKVNNFLALSMFSLLPENNK